MNQEMVRAIRRHLVIESAPPPLPDRDDLRYEAIAAWHLAQTWRTIDRHPDLLALTRPDEEV